MKCNIHNCEHIELSVYEINYISRKILGRLQENQILEDIFESNYEKDNIDIVEEAILDALTELGI